jgi:hypothetical protein
MSVAVRTTIPSSTDWRWRSFYDGTDWKTLHETIAPVLHRLATSMVSS